MPLHASAIFHTSATLHASVILLRREVCVSKCVVKCMTFFVKCMTSSVKYGTFFVKCVTSSVKYVTCEISDSTVSAVASVLQQPAAEVPMTYGYLV